MSWNLNTTEAGESLEEQVRETALSEAHAHLGRDLLPWVIGLFAAAAVQWVWFACFTGTGRFRDVVTMPSARAAVRIVLLVAVVGLAVGAVVEVVLIGESGARAVWQGRTG